MKKILFIIPYIPYPLDSGGNQAFLIWLIISVIECRCQFCFAQNPKNMIKYSGPEKLWANVDFLYINGLKRNLYILKSVIHYITMF